MAESYQPLSQTQSLLCKIQVFFFKKRKVKREGGERRLGADIRSDTGCHSRYIFSVHIFV